jgi:hypothetical protein
MPVTNCSFGRIIPASCLSCIPVVTEGQHYIYMTTRLMPSLTQLINVSLTLGYAVIACCVYVELVSSVLGF